MSINSSYESIVSLMAKLRADKASGPDSVAPKLLKFTGDSIILSLLSVLAPPATLYRLQGRPQIFQLPTISDNETDLHKSTTTTHVTGQGLGNPHQWVY